MHVAPMMSLIAALLDSEEKRSIIDRTFQFLKDTATTNIIGAGGIASTLAVVYWSRLKRFFAERKKSRDKNKLHLWNLVPWNFIPWKSREEREALILVEAINKSAFDSAGPNDDNARFPRRHISVPRRIAEAVSRTLSPSVHPEKAKLAWSSVALGHLKETQRYYVPPTCSVEESTRPRVAVDGIPSLMRWIGESSAASDDEAAGKFWVFAPGRAGKTIFMNRLFLELVGGGTPDVRAETSTGRPLPIPLLAAAETLRPHLRQIDALKNATDVMGKFAIAWLENRNIQIPEHRKPSIADSFKAALQGGEIILLLDGVDELRHQELGEFTENLLKDVKYWVASDRPDKSRLVPTHRSLFIDDVWTYEQIVTNLNQRLPDGSAMVHTREAVKEIVRNLIDRHEQEVRNGATDQEHHWLCEPDNLHLFVAELTPEMSERDIRRFAESRPNLFRTIFNKSVASLGGSADLTQISDRLFDLAVTDPTSPRPGSGSAAVTNDRINDQVEGLKQIIQITRKGPAFRHGAMRDYFLAGRIARDILDPAVRTDNTDELARNELWDSSKREAIESWLPHPISSKTVSRVRSRVKPHGAGGSSINPTMRRNLLDLLLAIDQGNPLQDLDLSQIPGEGIDLKGMTVQNCSFTKARLRSADLAGARFSQCDFTGADLSGANAIGTRFESCTFESNGETVHLAGMSIGADPADNRDTALSEERKTLKRFGAVEFRSRYRDEFADIWAQFQQVALGPGFVRLEGSVYLPAIEEALVKAGTNPVYAVDIMAGGSYQRVTNLLREHPNLHILGIDKDPCNYEMPDRFEWEQVHLGKPNSNGPNPLGLNLGKLLTDKFGSSAFPPQLIVAKKAVHEIDRSLQPLLIECCSESLADNGRLILFVDAPGPTEEKDLDRSMLAEVHSRLAARRKFLATGPVPSAVRAEVQELSFDDSPTSQIEFVNTWIMLKDWVNGNWTEVSNRYFASIAEIKQWASGSLNDCATTIDAYRLNPLIFNETGILSVLHHIAEQPPEERAQEIARDRRKLQGMIGESEKLDVLIDFSCDHLADGSPLGVALKAEERPINLSMLDPMLASLDSGRKAWSFELTCAVLVFEKGRAPTVSAGQ